MPHVSEHCAVHVGLQALSQVHVSPWPHELPLPPQCGAETKLHPLICFAHAWATAAASGMNAARTLGVEVPLLGAWLSPSATTPRAWGVEVPPPPSSPPPPPPPPLPPRPGFEPPQ